MKTRTLTIRGVPNLTLVRVRATAESNGRSLNGELLTILDRAAADGEALSDVGGGGPERTQAVREGGAEYAAPSPLDVDREMLAEICRRHHIEWLALFGSHARGGARPDSDVDVVVEFEEGRTPGFGIVRVAAELGTAFGRRRVDLVTRRGLSRRMRERVLESARTLYGEA